MTGFRRSNNTANKRVPNLLDSGYLRLREDAVKKVTVIEFGVKDDGGNGRGCLGIEIRADTAQLTNMRIVGFGER